MRKHLLILISLTFLEGCTVGKFDLREKEYQIPNNSNVQWTCPSRFTLSMERKVHTNTFGKKKSKPELISKTKREFEIITENKLNELNCLANDKINSKIDTVLEINILENKSLSALPQEWLTGLSFGVIPSWGTRPEQWIFEFKQGDYIRSYVVDDSRFNHIVAFPFFWLSFFTMDIESKYKEALTEFTQNP